MKSLPILLLSAVALSVNAAPEAKKDAEAKKPLRVLHLTGGCCHDYKNQKTILTSGISQRANVEFTVIQEDAPKGEKNTKHQYKILTKPGWEKDYDAVLYNICFAFEDDVDYIEGITNTHKAGLPAAVIHCTYHSHHWKAKTDTWEQFIGVTSPNHGPKARIKMTAKVKDHPVMKGFPDSWTTPDGELYNVDKVWPTATVLATGDNGKKDQACVWVNDFNGTRVFGTTVGHHNETVAENVYLDLVTRGLLWTTKNLKDDGTPVAGMGPKK